MCPATLPLLVFLTIIFVQNILYDIQLFFNPVFVLPWEDMIKAEV